VLIRALKWNHRGAQASSGKLVVEPSPWSYLLFRVRTFRLLPGLLGLILLGSCRPHSEPFRLPPEMAFFDLATTQPLEINSLHGKVLLLNLWAAWSPASAKELPELVALEEDYSKKGLVVLGVCLDDAPAAGLLVFAERHGIRYPLVRPGPLMVDLVEPVETIPYTILLNNEGKVIGRFRSPIKRAELRAAIEKNL